MDLINPIYVYHYCSMDTFYSIIKNRTIRLSDITKSNDSMEVLWILKYINEIFNGVYEKKTSDEVKLSFPFQEFQKYSRNSGFTFDNLNENSTCFVFCLSESSDQLSQWRGYADDGKGVSIGIKLELLKELGIPIDSNDPDRFLMFDKVKYLESKQRAIVRKVAENLIEGINKFYSTNNRLGSKPDNYDKKLDDFFEDAYSDLFEKSVFCKNVFFKEEHEWRLCHIRGRKPSDFYNSKNGLILKHGITLKNLSFLEKDSKLIPYLDIDFSRKNPNIDFISTIVIGPKASSSIVDVRNFLLSEHLDIANILIEKSQGTYR